MSLPFGNSKEVETNQTGIHQDLEKLVQRYLHTEYRRPVAEHTRKAFDEACEFLKKWNTPIVLDSGCGTGDSTLALAKKFPENPILGIDKSPVRLSKAQIKEVPENVHFVRAELLDFWKLAKEAAWKIRFHALFYPNPWPKQSELRYRFHAQPIFPLMLSLSPEFEMRTNWEIYAQEFAMATNIVFQDCKNPFRAVAEPFTVDQPETAFEKKFVESGHRLWRVQIHRL